MKPVQLILRLTSTLRCLAVSAVLSLLCQVAIAQSGQQAPADHALLERFPESTIVEYQEQADTLYELVLGNMRRIGGRVVAENSDRLRGNLTRITYEIPEGFSGDDVIEFYRAQIRDNSYVELFSCNGRGCGNSNYWANEVFENRSLYGPERNQYYSAVRSDGDEEAQSYAAIYVITRANRRLLAHIEILDVTVGDATAQPQAFSLDSLLLDGAVRVPGLTFDNEDRLIGSGGLEQVARLLQADPALRVFVVAHLQVPGRFDNLMQRSLRRAEQVRTELIARGVMGSRMAAQGVGPLAPLCSEGNCAERVELVIRQQD